MIPVEAEHEWSDYNGHFESTCYHPLLLFNRGGDCLAANLAPLPGQRGTDVAEADCLQPGQPVAAVWRHAAQDSRCCRRQRDRRPAERSRFGDEKGRVGDRRLTTRWGNRPFWVFRPTRSRTGPLRGCGNPLGLKTGLELRVCKPRAPGATLIRVKTENPVQSGRRRDEDSRPVPADALRELESMRPFGDGRASRAVQWHLPRFSPQRLADEWPSISTVRGLTQVRGFRLLGHGGATIEGGL